MTIKVAEPLPECPLCENPMLRATAERNGGLCDSCVVGIASTVRMLPPGRMVDLGEQRRRRLLSASARPPMVEGPQTVYVERYTPPVPHDHDALCDCAPQGDR